MALNQPTIGNDNRLLVVDDQTYRGHPPTAVDDPKATSSLNKASPFSAPRLVDLAAVSCPYDW
jgi:hypothetical protein